MTAWRRYVRACRNTAGVGTRADAVAVGVGPRTWQRRCDAEGWARPYLGVAIAPWARDRDAAILAAVIAAHGGAAGGETARWRLELGSRPRTLGVVVPHDVRARRVRPSPLPPDAPVGQPTADELAAYREHRRSVDELGAWHRRCGNVEVRRCRWLLPEDIQPVAGVPVLSPVATAISLAASHPEDVRGFIIDAQQAGKLRLADVRDRLEGIRAVPGRHVLRQTLDELEGRVPESVFHDAVLSVLERLGYRPTTRAIELVSPTGRELRPDVPLEVWKVAIELDGDRYHRDRDARRRDRDRLSAYAGTEWVPIIVDHRTWTSERERILREIDAAIDAQRARGIGADVSPPRLGRAAS